MSTGVVDQPTIGVKTADAPPAAVPITVTEKAAGEVKRIIADQQKLDLDTTVNEKTDLLSEQHGVTLVVDKKSLLYLQGAVIDFHEDLNARGFRITNPQAKGSCGCGSSYSM